MIDSALVEMLSAAPSTVPVDDTADRTSQRLLDAALQEAVTVGLDRVTVEGVVRRARVARMTAYRRYPRREDFIEALIHRETQRFLAAVAAAIATASSTDEGIAAAFIGAVTFAREHPMLRRVSETGPGEYVDTVASDRARVLRQGTSFIARYLHGGKPGPPTREQRWVADVCARLFLTYVAIPPTELNPDDDAQLRAFAADVLVPMIERVI